MQHRLQIRSAFALSLVALLAACHRGGGAGSGSQSATVAWSLGAPIASVHAPSGATAQIALPGLGSDFEFAAGATFVEQPGGRAHLVAVLERASEPAQRLALVLRLANELAPGDPHYDQLAQPRSELGAGAYLEQGGPIDVAQWRYYGISGGELRGLDALDGLLVALSATDATGLQCGPGATNIGLEFGASARLHAAVQNIPLIGVPGPVDGDLTLAFDLLPSERTYAAVSPGDATLGGVPSAALHAPALGGDYLLVGGGAFHERSDGSVQFEGVLADPDEPERRFALTLLAHARRDAAGGDAAPAGSPLLELPAAAYRASGGPIDSDAWRYYRSIEGRLRGVGPLQGAELRVRAGAAALQVGYGAGGSDAELGASANLVLDLLAQPFSGAQIPWSAGDARLRLALRGAYIANADEPAVDPLYAVGDGAALAVPGLATDFEVVAGGEYLGRADGRAEVRAEIQSRANPAEHWLLELELNPRLDPATEAEVPAGSPVLDLAPSAYAINGGPVDPGTWHYHTAVAGTLRGLGARQGAVLAVTRSGPAVQVGVGANGANLRFGLLGSLELTLVEPPDAGPGLPGALPAARIALTIERHSQRCAREAPRDAAVCALSGGYALHLPALGGNFVLEAGAAFAELADGSARLRGTLARASGAPARYLIDLALSGRVDAGMPTPAGSPVRELLPAAYSDAGGSIEPGRWHYYTTLEGSLLGLGNHAGANVRLTRSGAAFQVGRGANGRNVRFGASGWIESLVLVQPNSGPALPVKGGGGLHLDLFDSCP